MTGLFCIEEVENDGRLRLLLAALLFYLVVIFDAWAPQPGLAREAVEQANFMPMWPLERLGWRPLLPGAVLEPLLRLVGFGALFLAVRLLLKEECKTAFYFLLFGSTLELYLYLHDLRLVANFFHVHLYMCFFFLFSRSKMFFFRLGLCVIYWMAALVKLTPSWLWGEYFNSVPAHLPLFPKHPTVVWLAGVTLLLLELTGPLLWLSKRRRLRDFSALALIGFHLYSGFIVGHMYPTIMLPVAILALWPMSQPWHQGYRFQKRDAVCWTGAAVLLLMGLWNFLIPGDVRTTGEGRYHGLFMFDANRQVEIRLEVEHQGSRWQYRVKYGWPRAAVLDWTVNQEWRRDQQPWQAATDPVRDHRGNILFQPDYFARNSSRMFGDPYVLWYWAKELNQRVAPSRIGLWLGQQLDGHSEQFVVVDQSDFPIDLPYHPFTRNSFIQIPGPSAPRAYRWW